MQESQPGDRTYQGCARYTRIMLYSKRELERVAALIHPHRLFLKSRNFLVLWSVAPRINLWHKVWESCGITHASAWFLKRLL